MKKITRQERLDLLQNGFYRCGYIRIENVEELTSDFSRLKDKMTDEFTDKVRAINTKLSIAKIRSKDFIDNEGCFYDFEGKTFKHGEFLVHVYPFATLDGGTASISLLAE